VCLLALFGLALAGPAVETPASGQGQQAGPGAAAGITDFTPHNIPTQRRATTSQGTQVEAGVDDKTVPHFQVDPFWPKPLPNNWLLGQVASVAVGPDDHVWILQRPRSLTDDEQGATSNPPISKCCFPA